MNFQPLSIKIFKVGGGGGPKMAEEKDGEITYSPTNSSKYHLNAEQILHNNF